MAYAAGEHEEMLVSGPVSFLASWESKAEAHSIRPPGTGAAATNAYNTAMTATDSYAAPCGLELLTLTPHGRYDRAITPTQRGDVQKSEYKQCTAK